MIRFFGLFGEREFKAEGAIFANLKHFTKKLTDTPLLPPHLTLLLDMRQKHERAEDAMMTCRAPRVVVACRAHLTPACCYLALPDLVHYDALDNMAFWYLPSFFFGFLVSYVDRI